MTFVHFAIPYLMNIKKKRLKEIIHNAFYFIHGWQRYKFTVLAHELTYVQSQNERQIVLHRKQRSHLYLGGSNR